MENVIVVNIFDAEVVHDQGERYVTGDMLKEAVGGACTDVTVLCQMLDKIVMRYFSPLF